MDYAGRRVITKFQYTRLLAAALAHLVSRQGDAVGLVTYADALQPYLPSRGGQVHLRALLLTLSRTDPGGRTDGAAALSGRIDLLKRRGLLIVISDLYDERDLVERALMRASHMGHEVVVFHVLTATKSSCRFVTTWSWRIRRRVGLCSRTARRPAGRTVKRSARSSSAGARVARRTASTTSACSPTRRSRPRCAGICGAARAGDVS